ncbi:MAG: hypothetical protein RQ982_01805 [Gammaproteobacteria bacterium]|nr:hypothetical protein [Gammaproteobacteria bacterium]
MKIFFTLFALVAVLLAGYPFLDSSEKSETLSGLPWQIEIQADGSTQVFGLHIGVSRLSDAVAALGSDYELAIIAATSAVSADQTGNLEMYFGHYQSGLLSGKMVLLADSSEQSIKRWLQNEIKSDYMASGQAKKHSLSSDDLPEVLNEVITGITFIPAINLDEKTLLSRFGAPQQIIRSADVTHYLYPEKGLDIALYEKSKEVLQYVSPTAFQQLVKPLL